MDQKTFLIWEFDSKDTAQLPCAESLSVDFNGSFQVPHELTDFFSPNCTRQDDVGVGS